MKSSDLREYGLVSRDIENAILHSIKKVVYSRSAGLTEVVTIDGGVYLSQCHNEEFSLTKGVKVALYRMYGGTYSFLKRVIKDTRLVYKERLDEALTGLAEITGLKIDRPAILPELLDESRIEEDYISDYLLVRGVTDHVIKNLCNKAYARVPRYASRVAEGCSLLPD